MSVASATTAGPVDPKDTTDAVTELEREVVRLRSENEVIRCRADRYQALFEALPVSVQVVDRDGLIVEVNPFHLAKMGNGRTSPTDYRGQPIVGRPSIVASGLANRYAATLAGHPFQVNEAWFPALSGGGNGYFNVRGVPLKEGEVVVGAIFISEDVTEPRKAKDELVVHKETLEQLVEARTASLREALENVKTLRGLVPICASCKKIRDPKGYWSQLEAYLSSHSDLEFTHGFCPECVDRLYPKRDPGEESGNEE